MSVVGQKSEELEAIITGPLSGCTATGPPSVRARRASLLLHDSSRYELSDAEWTATRPRLPNRPSGVPRVNDRRGLNAMFLNLRSGAPWRDLPRGFFGAVECAVARGRQTGVARKSQKASMRRARQAATVVVHIAADRRKSAFRGDPGTLALGECLHGRDLALGKSAELLGDHLVRFCRRLRPAFGDQGEAHRDHSLRLACETHGFAPAVEKSAHDVILSVHGETTQDHSTGQHRANFRRIV